MYFDFEDRRFDTPTIESAMSWRECSLLSLFTHLLVVMVLLLLPRLQFVQDAADRRAERLAEMVEEQQLALLQTQDEPEFIFVQPLVDVPSPALPQAALSDIDRVAQSLLQAETPVNNLPNAEGNSLEFVESEDPSDGLDPVTESGTELEAAQVESVEPIDGVVDGVTDAPELDAPEPDLSEAITDGDSAPANPFLADREDALRETPTSERPGTILNQALRTLDRVARSDSFYNFGGRTSQLGPQIQFDTKGVEFGPWIRRFVAQIRRNWFIPYAVLSMSGHVVLTFNVHEDGSLTDLSVEQPSIVDAFTNSAFNALRGSNPTQPLPPEYPDDKAFFTVIFYFNERPPGR